MLWSPSPSGSWWKAQVDADGYDDGSTEVGRGGGGGGSGGGELEGNSHSSPMGMGMAKSGGDGSGEDSFGDTSGYTIVAPPSAPPSVLKPGRCT